MRLKGSFSKLSLTIGVIFFSTLISLGLCHSKVQLIQLNEENWQNMLKGEWMVEFFAPWCPACNNLQATWEDFASWSTNEVDLSVAQVDVTTSPGLSGRFMVTALPTIYHVINGEFRQYKGSRDKESLISFIQEQKWQGTDPIPSWKSPSSVQMSLLSYFFRLSQLLRDVHNKLMQEYGFPSWVSYLAFAVVTIILGALLGLVLVCCIDFVYPPKSARYIQGDGKSEDDDDAVVEEELEDDLVLDGSSSSPNAGLKKRKARKAD